MASGETKTGNELPCEILPLRESQFTPMTKAESLIDTHIPSISTPDKNKVKKQILQLNVLNISLEAAYQQSDKTTKQILKNIVSSETVQKYNLKMEVTKTLGLKRVRKFNKKGRIYKEAKEIQQFFSRDDNTRIENRK